MDGIIDLESLTVAEITTEESLRIWKQNHVDYKVRCRFGSLFRGVWSQRQQLNRTVSRDN